MSDIKFESLTDGIIAVLQGAGLLVGDGEAPPGAGWQGKPGQSNFSAYCTVHPLLGGLSSGSIDEPHGDGEVVYQVSCYGPTRSQAEIVASLVQKALTSTYPSVVGLSVRYVDDDVFGGARRDDVLQPPVWQAVPRYRFYTTST